jgi:hypothetical protein
MVLIFAQPGATSWGFQIGKLYWYINYPSFWRRCGLGTWGIQQEI